MSGYNVVFYSKEDGTEPAKDFILSQDKKHIAKTLRLINMLEFNGPALREPSSKPLGDGIFELRVQVATNISRVLYFFYVDKRIVLTNGFVKKTQKTPSNEIEKAKQYRDDFISREGK